MPAAWFINVNDHIDLYVRHVCGSNWTHVAADPIQTRAESSWVELS